MPEDEQRNERSPGEENIYRVNVFLSSSFPFFTLIEDIESFSSVRLKE